MEYQVGTVEIKDDRGNVLLERTLAEDYGFKVNSSGEEGFFAFKPIDAEDTKICVQKALEWSLEGKGLTLAFGSQGPFRKCMIIETGFDKESDCIRIRTIDKKDK